MRRRIDREVARGVAISTVVESELRFGLAKVGASLEKTQAPETFLSLVTILPFDSDAAREHARVRASLERAGPPIGPNDPMIAATALARNLSFVTHNLAEFARVPGFAVEDGEA